MPQSTEALKRRIHSAGELRSVVHTMKVLAASAITPYEQASKALSAYAETVELGMATLLSQGIIPYQKSVQTDATLAIVFGSDQGMVGAFNEHLAEFAVSQLNGQKAEYWSVGERIIFSLNDHGIMPDKSFSVAGSLQEITPLVIAMLNALAPYLSNGSNIQVFYHHHLSRAEYEPHARLLMPLQGREDISWPRKQQPEIIGDEELVIAALLREYIYTELFHAAADSAASEHITRLASMERAEKNIDDTLEELQRRYHMQRQEEITEELMDITAGFEALK